jgi:hypothetical protein
VLTAEFYIQGPKGNPFGEKIAIKLKIVEKVDETEFYDRAMAIHKKLGVDFDKIVQTLANADNNVDAAIKMLS